MITAAGDDLGPRSSAIATPAHGVSQGIRRGYVPDLFGDGARGLRNNPSWVKVRALAQALGVSVAELMGSARTRQARAELGLQE